MFKPIPGVVTLNDRCIVRMTKLGRHTRPVYVNGQPIGIFSGIDGTSSDFAADPLKRCGTLTDPVNGARFNPTRTSSEFEFKDRPYGGYSSTRLESSAGPACDCERSTRRVSQ